MSIQARPQNQRVSKDISPTNHQIYPAFAFPAAPTFQKWVKLTAADVHALRTWPPFEDQNIYFHLNHPIEFVYVIGPVVAIDHVVTAYNTRFSLLEIDDGSGATIEAKISYKLPPSASSLFQAQQSPKLAAANKQQQDAEADDGETQSSSSDSSTASPTGKRSKQRTNAANSETTTTTTTPLQKPQVFETTARHLTVVATPTSTDLVLHTPKSNRRPETSTKLTVGTIIKAKGKPQQFRKTMQLSLKRAFLVTSAAEELAAWASYADFVHSVLSVPWVLSPAELRRLEDKQAAEDADRRLRAASRKQWEERRMGKRQEYERKVEARLEAEAARKDFDGNALDRVGWMPHVPVAAPVSGPGATAGRLVAAHALDREADGDARAEPALWQHELVRFSR